MQQPKIALQIDELIDRFILNLEKRKIDITHISNLQCGFEKWMQLEFIIWAINEYNLNPLNPEETGIGVEHFTKIIPPSRNWKIIDIWVGAKEKGFFYIEFKSTVKGWNTEKQISSWIDDFIILSNIHSDYKPYGIASVLFGSATEKWTDLSWKDFVVKRMYKSSIPTPNFKKIGNLGIAILSKQNNKN